MFKEFIFREYDIRGVFEKDFDLQFAQDLGAAYVEHLKKSLNKSKITLTVGHDARLSSPAITKSITEGIIGQGADVILLGLITTPISYFSTFQLKIDGAFMITGSHNPPDYNGFKVSRGKSTIFGEEIQSLMPRVGKTKPSSEKGRVSTYDIFPEYLERYKKEFKDLKSIPVTVDCGNGAAGAILRRLYEGVGLKPHIIFEEPDGRFPNHHPDPTEEKNMVALKKEVLANKSRVGIGFDGDADRIGLVDEKGRFILGDELMMLVSRDLLSQNKDLKIIGDVKCSDRLFNDIKKLGGKPIMWKTGHSLVKNKIKEESAPFGGELSGHVFFADRNYGYDDAPYAGLRIIEILSKTDKTIDQLLEGIPFAFNTPEIRIDTTEANKLKIVEEVRRYCLSKKYSVNEIDGVRVSFPTGWALVRSSNTQPVVVVRFESSSKETLAEMQSEFMAVISPHI